jgi:L-serine deaminase
MTMNLGRYSKLIAALVAGAIGWATLVVNSPAAHISAQEWIVGATYLASAFGVFVVPNQYPLTDEHPGD